MNRKVLREMQATVDRLYRTDAMKQEVRTKQDFLYHLDSLYFHEGDLTIILKRKTGETTYYFKGHHGCRIEAHWKQISKVKAAVRRIPIKEFLA